MKSDIVQYGKRNTNAPRDASGLQYSGLGGGDDKLIICNPATLGRKFCRFLRKYDNTIWTDAENYYSDFSDIQFLNDIYLYPCLILKMMFHIVEGGEQVKIFQMEKNGTLKSQKMGGMFYGLITIIMGLMIMLNIQ